MLIAESLVAKLLDIERASTEILSSGISMKRFDRYASEATVDNLFYLGKIFFPKLTFLDAKRIAKGKENPELQIMLNFRKTLEYIKYQSEFSSITSPIANHINKLICDNIVENWQPRYLGSKNKYDNSYDFTSIKPDECDTIENIVMLTSRTELPILRSAQLFQYVIQYKPFVAMNDITALALACYECFRFYRKTANILSFSRILLATVNLDAIIESNEILDLLVSGIHGDISSLRDRILKHSYQDRVDKNSKYSDLTERQLALLRYLQNSPKIKRRQYMKLFKVSTMTAFRDLSDLVEKKIISVKGVGRGTYYEIEKIN